MDFRNDPKLQGMADKISAQVTAPTTTVPPPTKGALPPNPLPPAVSNKAPQQPPQNVTQYFQQTSDKITSNSKKKQLMIAGICAGAVFLFCFIFLCAFKPAFVMKKKYDGSVEKRSVSFLVVFIISIILAAIVMILGLFTAFKK